MRKRDRRLFPDEEARILAQLGDSLDERVFFEVARDTAMQMRECYTLDISQVVLGQRTIHLDRTKNGDRRQVPLPSPTVAMLSDYIGSQKAAIGAREGRLFPFWSCDRNEAILDQVTRDLSRVYANIFEAVGVADFRFHDLRLEATCRLFQRTTLRDTEIAKITGHKDPRQLKRYASLRGSDLVSQLW